MAERERSRGSFLGQCRGCLENMMSAIICLEFYYPLTTLLQHIASSYVLCWPHQLLTSFMHATQHWQQNNDPPLWQSLDAVSECALTSAQWAEMQNISETTWILPHSPLRNVMEFLVSIHIWHMSWQEKNYDIAIHMSISNLTYNGHWASAEESHNSRRQIRLKYWKINWLLYWVS